MKFVKTASLAAAAAAVAMSASADDINPWTDCGIGAAIFPGSETGAIISNVIWDLGTTAVTSAMSSPESCSGDNVETAMFIQNTYASLETELATGEGENLDALAELVGAEDKDAFTVALRTEFAPVVAAGEARPETLYFATQAVAQG